MPPSRRKPTKILPLRKTPQLRLASRPVIELGVLNDRLGYFVRRVQVWVFQDFIRRLSSIDLSPAQFSVLVVIGANTDLSQSELAATLGIERARLVRLLHRLERRGLTQRLPSSADGRRHALRLTRAGQTLLANEFALQLGAWTSTAVPRSSLFILISVILASVTNVRQCGADLYHGVRVATDGDRCRAYMLGETGTGDRPWPNVPGDRLVGHASGTVLGCEGAAARACWPVSR